MGEIKFLGLGLVFDRFFPSSLRPWQGKWEKRMFGSGRPVLTGSYSKLSIFRPRWNFFNKKICLRFRFVLPYPAVCLRAYRYPAFSDGLGTTGKIGKRDCQDAQRAAGLRRRLEKGRESLLPMEERGEDGICPSVRRFSFVGRSIYRSLRKKSSNNSLHSPANTP